MFIKQVFYGVMRYLDFLKVFTENLFAFNKAFICNFLECLGWDNRKIAINCNYLQFPRGFVLGQAKNYN